MDDVPPPPPSVLGSRANSVESNGSDDVPLSRRVRGRVLSPARVVAELSPLVAPPLVAPPVQTNLTRRVVEPPLAGPSIPAPGPSIPVARPTTGGKGFMSRPTPVRHSRKGNKTGNIKVVSEPAVRRLARRAGVKRISGEIYAETQNVAKEFLTKVLEKSCIYMSDRNPKAKTLDPGDVVRALGNMGMPIYGFGPR